jgi:hypothetical protein
MLAPKKVPITGLGYDPDFGGIDLTGCPSIQPQLSSSDSNWLDPRFAPLDQSGQGQGNALKEFLTERLAEQESPSVIHVSNEPFTIRFRDKLWHGEGTLAGQRHRLAASSRDQLIGKLMQLAKPRAAFRSLTPEEELEVIRLCQCGDKLSGIGVYLKHAIGEARTNQYHSPIEMMADPKLIPVMDACCNFCWFHSHPHAIDTPDWHEYKDRILAGRPVTFDLLDAIWLRYQDHLDQQNQKHSFALLSDAPKPEDPRETLAQLNDLDDASIDRLMHQTRLQSARDFRAGRG